MTLQTEDRWGLDPVVATILTTAHRLESCRLTVRDDLPHGTATPRYCDTLRPVPTLEPTTSTHITVAFLQLGERRTTVAALGADGASAPRGEQQSTMASAWARRDAGGANAGAPDGNCRYRT